MRTGAALADYFTKMKWNVWDLVTERNGLKPWIKIETRVSPSIPDIFPRSPIEMKMATDMGLDGNWQEVIR